MSAPTVIEVLWEVQQTLADTYTFVGTRIWLQSRNSNLDMQRPEDLIKSGQHELVLAEARRVAGDGNAT
jgi:hypothetical protein